MTATKPKFAVGMTVIVAEKNRRHEVDLSEATIIKIGRKWATVKMGWRELRFDIETMMIDGGDYFSSGAVHLSKADYDDAVETDRLWALLHKSVSWRPPQGMKSEAVKQAIHTLGLSHILEK